MQKYITSAVFFAVIYWIYGFVRPEWCNFHEQYQMFLFGWDYLTDHLSVASGMADYAAEFVVQFFFFPKLGAAFWAGLLLLMGFLVYKVSRVLAPGSGDGHFALALLPSLLMEIYCGNQNVMLAFPVSLICALALLLLYNRLGVRWRIYVQIVAIPLIYWLIGYGVFLYALLAAFMDYRRFYGRVWQLTAITAAYAILSVMSVVICGYTVMRQYPFIDLYCGINFYRERLIIPDMQHWVTAATAVSALGLGFLPSCGKVLAIVETALVSMAAPLLLPFSHDGDTYTMLKIDYLVRNQQWEDVIDVCAHTSNLDEMGYTGLNLALAKTNQLADRMFCWPQCGQNGLISIFKRNMVSCTISAEACYHLGLINTVLRLYYDSQEAILNCNKSARFSHRIAEAFLINGDYDVAAKYIRQLKRTLFYSGWAVEAESCLYHPDQVMGNKRWASIIRRRIPEDVLYSVTDMSDMLLMLHRQSPDNQLALQYAMACDLLTGNLDHFMKYFPITQGGRTNMAEFRNVPKAYQEAIAYKLIQQNGLDKGLPPFITQDVAADLRDFDRFLLQSTGQMPQGRLYATYWRYILSQ